MGKTRSTSLTDRDKQILELLAEGLNRKQIAEQLGLSWQCVYNRMTQMDNRGFGHVLHAIEEGDRKKGRLRDY